MKWRSRNRFSYKVKMFFYRLTFRDIEDMLSNICFIVFEIVTAILGFLFIFIFPALFH